MQNIIQLLLAQNTPALQVKIHHYPFIIQVLISTCIFSLLVSITLLVTWKKLFNPLSPNSDQHQTSPSNINAYSIPEVMRIKDMIIQGEFS